MFTKNMLKQPNTGTTILYLFFAFFVIYVPYRLVKIFILRAELDRLYAKAVKKIYSFIELKKYTNSQMFKMDLLCVQHEFEAVSSLIIDSDYLHWIVDKFKTLKNQTENIFDKLIASLSKIKAHFSNQVNYVSQDRLASLVLQI